MKNIFNLILLLSLSIAMQSCFSMQDEVWIEADGSGRLEATMDLSSMYPFLMMGLQEGMNKDKDGDGKPEESDPFTSMMNGMLTAEEIDTTINFGDMIGSALAEEGMSWEQMLDSLRNAPPEADVTEEQKEVMLAMFEEMQGLHLRMQSSKANQTFKSTTIQSFESIGTMNSFGETMMEMIELMAEEEGNASPFGQGGEGDAILQQFSNAQTQLDLNGNTLRIRRAGMDVSILGEEFEQNFSMIKMFLGNEPYRMIVHFPGKVRKVSSSVAEKVDKNTVAIEIPLDDLFDPEKILDVEVQFKGLKK